MSGGTRFVTLGAVLGALLVACAPRSGVSDGARAPAGAEAADAGGGGGGLDDDEQADADDGEEDEDGEVVAEDVPASDERCPEGMVPIETSDRSFCVDRYEASLVEILPDGTEQPYPHYKSVGGHSVRAVSVAGVFPQGFISELQARDACLASGKRLCTHAEWKTACMGPERTAFPYGETRSPGTCHDQGKSAVVAVFGAKAVLASTPFTPRAVAPASGSASGSGKTATAKGATAQTSKKPAGKTAAGKTAAATKTAAAPKKPAHATGGRAAQTVKTRPTRTAAAKPTPPKRASATTTGKTARASSASKATKPGRAPTTKKRIAAKASTRPADVDPGVWAKLNEPALGQVEGALARTGEHPGCVNGWGVVDMVGNLHEWVATDTSLPHGTFAGGYYLDTTLNGDGCHYRTVAHAHDYHDYSTGFRCCADLASP